MCEYKLLERNAINAGEIFSENKKLIVNIIDEKIFSYVKFLRSMSLNKSMDDSQIKNIENVSNIKIGNLIDIKD